MPCDSSLKSDSYTLGARRRRATLPVLGLLAALGVHCSPRAAEPELPTAPLVQPLSVTLADCNASSLIKAINDANTAGAGPHTIALRGGCTYSLVTRDNYWYGPNGLPPITSDITIDGGPQGASIERAAGSPAFRLFYVASAAVPPSKAGSLTLRSVTVRSGLSRGGNTAPNIHSGGGGLGAGGAIFAHGNVNLDRVLLQSNVAQGGSSGTTAMGGDCGGGGGMGGDAGGHGGGGFQSAVGDDGGDGVMGGEGGHSGDSLMGPGAGGSDTSGNENGSVGVALVGGNGGGTRGLGARGALASGTAGDGGAGAGARVTGGGGGGGAGFGGSGGNGITTVTQGTSGGGGGFGGGGGRAQNGGGGGGGGGVGGGGGASIGDAGGSGGGGFGGGGGSCYAGGTGGFGGGGGCGNTGSASGIFGGGSGGVGAPCSGGGGAGFGGAVFVHLGTLTLTNSTLTGNSALGGAAGSATGGGLGTVGAGLGGAVFNLNGTVNLTNATLSGNVTSYGGPQAGGALYMTTFGVGTPTAAAVIKNSILAGSVNTTAAASGDVALNQVIGTMTFDVTTANIIQAAIARVVGNETVTGTPMMASPNLDTLKNNGGPTQTLAPRGNSPAVDTADDATCLMTPGEGVDQRNFNRPIGVHCDIGAFEVGAVAGARNGAACTANDGCASSFCADGFCCNTSCGGGVATDCVSCAAAQSGGKNGVCSTLPAELKFACRPVGGSCDVEEVCDGTSAACPADKVLPAATVCMAATTTTQLDATCDGTAPACPSNPPAYQLSGGGLGGCTAATGGATAGASGAAGAAGAALAMAALLYTARRRSRRHLA